MRNVYWMAIVGVAVVGSVILAPTTTNALPLPATSIKMTEEVVYSDNCDGLKTSARIDFAVNAQGLPVFDCPPVLTVEAHHHKMWGTLFMPSTETTRCPITATTPMPFIKPLSDPLGSKAVVSASNGGTWVDVISGTQKLVCTDCSLISALLPFGQSAFAARKKLAQCRAERTVAGGEA